MEAVFFVISVIGVLAVMHWSLTNDSAGNRGPTKGLFAMRDFVAEAAAEDQRLKERGRKRW
jgi:hypothetical protein